MLVNSLLRAFTFARKLPGTYPLVDVGTLPFYFPMQNLERAYYFDKESEAAFWSRFLSQ